MLVHLLQVNSWGVAKEVLTATLHHRCETHDAGFRLKNVIDYLSKAVRLSPKHNCLSLRKLSFILS